MYYCLFNLLNDYQMLKIYNSLTKTKEPFQPIVEGKVNIYVCGITVYDYCHVGHARTFNAFDVIIRYLRYLGYKVNYVRNITDIDDKIINRSNETNHDFTKLTSHFIEEMHRDFENLGLEKPDNEPRATHTISTIINQIEILIKKGFAYATPAGNVYYDVKRFPSYGKLSGRKLDELRKGTRIEIGEDKKDPLDFALWKSSKPNEPNWDSPWGKGRPGWHIECSAMATNYLAENIDIHGGGNDLMFPHHENEIAQAEAATGKKFVNYWMHCGHLQIDKAKMSKSLKNFFTIRDVLEQHQPEVLRYFFISAHYTSPLNYSEESLKNAHSALERLYTALRDIKIDKIDTPSDDEFTKRFIDAMDDDFNTPGALSVLFDLAREINRIKATDKPLASKMASNLVRLGSILNILQQSPDDFFQKTKIDDNVTQKVEELIAQRNQARKNRDWKKSDEIRDELTSLGVALEDTPSGTTWKKM